MSALDRGVRQVVIGGAGYDGRALRYAKPRVRWFEVDHPATQPDKVERVARLNVAAGHIRFIPADFTADPIAEPLLAAGLDPASPTLFLLEGVAVYLERPVVERVLAAFRQLAADGSELAISVSVATSTSLARSRFQERLDCLPVLGHGLRSTNRRDPPAAPADVQNTAESPGATALPLWALLSRPLLAFALEYERAPGPSVAVSANVLGVLTEGGVRTRDIPALAGISKESVAMAVGLLAESGLATEGPDPDGSRFKVTRLTAAGAAARDAYPARAADIEADWRARFGGPGRGGPGRAGTADRRRPAPAVRRARALPGQLARPGQAARGPPALPDDPAPRRLPGRCLARPPDTVGVGMPCPGVQQ